MFDIRLKKVSFLVISHSISRQSGQIFVDRIQERRHEKHSASQQAIYNLARRKFS